MLSTLKRLIKKLRKKNHPAYWSGQQNMPVEGGLISTYNWAMNNNVVNVPVSTLTDKMEQDDRIAKLITTTELIGKLCKTYKVQLVGFAGYARNVPMEAINELEEFSIAYEKVRGDDPFIWLIVDVGGKEHKKDPIMLAASPFGRWYYILGAWDKEVEIVDDLIYNGK